MTYVYVNITALSRRLDGMGVFLLPFGTTGYVTKRRFGGLQRTRKSPRRHYKRRRERRCYELLAIDWVH